MADGVCELRPPAGLEVRKQVELTGVIGAVAAAAERYDAESIAAPAERPRDQVRRVDPVGHAADDAGQARDGEPLAVGRRKRLGSLQRCGLAQGCAGAQLGAPVKRCPPHVSPICWLGSRTVTEAVRSAAEWLVTGRPTPFAGGENERRWKAELAEQSPRPAPGLVATSVDAGFVLGPGQDGPGCDLDNLLDPVLSVLVNRLGWAGSRRPNLLAVSANKTFGAPTGARIRFGAHEQARSSELLLDAIYDGPLPRSARDPVFADWVALHMRGVLGGASAAVSLSFARTSINLGDTATGSIKPLIDGLWPVLGGHAGDPQDWRIRRLSATKGRLPTGAVGVTLSVLDPATGT